MQGLRLEHFIGAGRDVERAQYEVLGRLQQVRQAFSRNIVYPYLADLVKLYGSLQNIIDNLEHVRDQLSGEIMGVDLETPQVLRQQPTLGSGQIDHVEELIRWALPYVQDAIEEGRTIYEFVEDHLSLEEVGIVPSYTEEGYVILPDRKARQLHILRYTLSVFTRADERFRSLQTAYVKSLPRGYVAPSPRSIKLDLVDEQPDLPNPATYFIDTDLDFPYEETVLPVSKRKLMRYLARQHGQA
jgi:hypothetical protein